MPREVLSDPKLLYQFYSGIGLDQCKWLSALLKALVSIGRAKIGFSPVGATALIDMQESIRHYRNQIKQHAPLPTRIYQHLLARLEEELHTSGAILDRLLSLAKSCSENLLLGRTRGVQKEALRTPEHAGEDLYPDFLELLHAEGLKSYFLQRGYPLDTQGLSKAITEVQILCKTTVIAFTGMRDSECERLGIDCDEEFISSGKKIHLVRGETSKLNNGIPKACRWVTNAVGHFAISLARRIATVISDFLSSIGDCNAPSAVTPIFLSAAYLRLGGGRAPHSPNGCWLNTSADLSSNSNLRSLLLPSIFNEDLLELESIDQFRAWRTEPKFQIGSTWPLTSHQLRRSLALYASKSGLVSLPSLRRQLQHLTEAMATYYARGSQFANDFIGNHRDHFGLEYREAQPVSQALSFIRHVLLSDEPIFGVQATLLKRRTKENQGEILINRDRTMLQFKNGELSYIETALGGCMSLEPCTKRAMRSLAACIPCRSLMGRRSKLVRTISVQKEFLDGLNLGSVEARTEQNELHVLEKALATLDAASN
jgi:hypothetical protein